MRRLLLMILVCLPGLTVAGGNAQSPAATREKPVWTVELVQSKPGRFGLAMGYLDDHWMLVREEARRKGLVVSYHRMAEESSSSNDAPTIILLTEFRNQAACDSREAVFGAIEESLANHTSDVLPRPEGKDLYNLISTRVFRDYSESPATRMELLAQQ